MRKCSHQLNKNKNVTVLCQQIGPSRVNGQILKTYNLLRQHQKETDSLNKTGH